MSFTPNVKPSLPYAADKAAANANLKAGNYAVTPADLKYDETAAAPGAEDRGVATAKAAANIQPSSTGAGHGFTPNPPPPAPYVPDSIDKANKDAAANEHGPVQDVFDMIRAVPSGLLPAFKGMLHSIPDLASAFNNPSPDNPIVAKLHGVIKNFLADPQGSLTSVGNTLRTATPQQVGQNVVAPIVAGEGIGGAASLAGKASDALAGS